MSESDIIRTVNGEEYIVACRTNIENKKFIITIDRKVLIEDENHNIYICKKDDKFAKILYEYLAPPKSLDVKDIEPER